MVFRCLLMHVRDDYAIDECLSHCNKSNVIWLDLVHFSWFLCNSDEFCVLGAPFVATFSFSNCRLLYFFLSQSHKLDVYLLITVF